MVVVSGGPEGLCDLMGIANRLDGLHNRTHPYTYADIMETCTYSEK